MAGRPTGWAYKHVKTGDPLAKLILAALADNADDNGRCYPSQKNLSAKTEVSVSTVKRKLRMLESFGIIQVIRKQIDGQKRRNFYRLRIEKAFDLTKETGQITDVDEPGEIGVTQTPIDNDGYPRPEETGATEREELTGVTVTPISEIGVTQTPIEKNRGHSDPYPDDDRGQALTPVWGQALTHEPSYNLTTTHSNNLRGAESEKIPGTTTVKVGPDWKPNEYIFETLKFKFGIPRAFAEDALPLFTLNYRDESKKQNRLEKTFVSWIRGDWEKFRREWESKAEPITPDWEPADQVLQILERQGIDPVRALALVPEFRLYWLESGAPRPSFGSLFVRYCSQNAHRRHDGGTPQEKTESKLRSLGSRAWAGG